MIIQKWSSISLKRKIKPTCKSGTKQTTTKNTKKTLVINQQKADSKQAVTIIIIMRNNKKYNQLMDKNIILLKF